MKVTITFDPSKVKPVDERPHAQICDMFQPGASYTESAAYEGSNYDSNVPGRGYAEQKEPYASTSVPMPVPFAQFKMAVQQKDPKAEGGVQTVEITVDDYKEAMYYKQLGEDMKDQGFSVKVEDSEAV